MSKVESAPADQPHDYNDDDDHDGLPAHSHHDHGDVTRYRRYVRWKINEGENQVEHTSARLHTQLREKNILRIF